MSLSTSTMRVSIGLVSNFVCTVNLSITVNLTRESLVSKIYLKIVDVTGIAISCLRSTEIPHPLSHYCCFYRDERRSVLFPESIEKVKIEPTTVKEEPNQEVPGFLSDPGSKGIDHSSFKPFQASPAKQTRYEQYLVCLQNNRKDALKFLQPKDMTEWERERERVEFERAAHLYRPMKTTMASRFVSAGSSNDSDEGKRRSDPFGS